MFNKTFDVEAEEELRIFLEDEEKISIKVILKFFIYSLIISNLIKNK